MSSGNKLASLGILAATSALSFGLAAPFASLGLLGNAAVGLGLGAAMGGLGLLVRNKTPGSNREIEDINFTTSVRNTVVPVLFGRARLAGNYLIQGNFFRAKTKKEDFGARVYVTHCIIGLCEGPLKFFGNKRIDGKTIRQLAEETYETDEDNLYLELIIDPLKDVSGTPTEGIPDALTAELEAGKEFYKTLTRPVPWRNTAKLDVRAIVGASPTLINVSGDAIGPDYSVRRVGDTGGETNPHDSIFNTSGTAFYDSYTQCIYYTVSSSSHWPIDSGLVRIGRTGDEGYEHTEPPASVSDPVGKAWYIGKHDVLVMQDPNDDGLFWIGYWGISASSTDWTSARPHPGYDTAIAAMHLDEHNTSLHTLHASGSETYILRWNLFTGRVEKTTITDLDGTATAMIYSSDHHCYVITDDGGSLWILNADDGGLIQKNTTLNLTSIRALCGTGARIGIIKVNGFLYYDWSSQTVSGPYGGSSTTITNEGAFGGLKACSQNTRTGQVLLGRESAGDTNAEWVLFIPSVVEDLEDISANGSPKELEFQWDLEEADCAPILNQSDTSDWVRDWSWRKYSGYSMVALEGSSSLAAALYASLVSYQSIDPTMTDTDDVPLDTARWGAGIDESLVDLPSFEALHAYCVGGVIYKNVLRTFNCDPDADVTDSSSASLSDSGGGSDEEVFVERWAERFKFDMLLDSESSWIDFAMNMVLPACNGYLIFEDGKLHAGYNRTGAFAVWHFSNDQIDDENPAVISFNGRSGGSNRIRIQFLEVRDEYRVNLPAEWNDEWMQNAAGRVRSQTLTISGCGRHGQAELIGKLIGDLAASARQSITFGTNFLGNVLSAGDVIEVSDAGTGLDRKRFKVISVQETEGDLFRIDAQEWQPLSQLLKDNPVASPPPPGPRDECDDCGDPFEWETGAVSEHALGGTTKFVRSSSIFEICLSGSDSIQFLGTSDDFVILTAAGDIPQQTYSGTSGDPVDILIKGKYIIFRPTEGSLRATDTVEKNFTDEFSHASTIPSGSGSAYDQVTDFEADGWDTRAWGAVTKAEMLANGWINAEGVARLQFHHIVCGNGFAKVDGFYCVPPISDDLFLAFDTGEVSSDIGEGCESDRRWFSEDVESYLTSLWDLLADDSATESYRRLVVDDSILANTHTSDPQGPDWPSPHGPPETHWISAKCSGQWHGNGSDIPTDPDETGSTYFWTYFWIGDYYSDGAGNVHDNWWFPFNALGDDGIGQCWINGVEISVGGAFTCPGNSHAFGSSPNYGALNSGEHPLVLGWNKMQIKVGSVAYARGVVWYWGLPIYETVYTCPA